MAEAGAGASTTDNSPTWGDQVISILTRERDQLSALQGLKSADTQAAERAAWKRVQDALEFQIFQDGRLPIKLSKRYDGGDSTAEYGTRTLESEAEAIDLIERALDALSSDANLATALDPDGTGIFDHWDARNDGDNNAVAPTDIRNFVNAGKTKVNGRTFAQMRGQWRHRTIATLGTTSYTRFGVWRGQAAQNAYQLNAVQNFLSPPGTFAYSPLDPTNAGTTQNPGFPSGGSASYTGETVALQERTFLAGTVRVDVSWEATLNDAAFNTDTGNVGTMWLTISGLASAEGDPLSHGGSATAPGNEIADIVLGNFTIRKGDAGANADDLIVGTRAAVTPATTPATYTYSEVAPSSSPRLRFSDPGMADNTATPAQLPIDEEFFPREGASVKALFVGQGVDGPLGVIGTWSLTVNQVGRVSADGTEAVDRGAAIYGAFGAEAP